ncbi:Dimeric dUTPase, all-alpha-NTP-PPase (MazG) superfamily [Bacillus sp. OV322]|uniref:dUTP diphosphatase n=1 Tax=Bacillus sp. OV322 TaxID=1882764 RepID=UPI0008E58AAB|nr:dUTP diphosphatase [Bacillus sp. OV322]SFC56687.1 Dimeric dUTPase, all-alpha-NTP-PPase (MazG) superfamily [Bacillus sp. OV322]
MNLHKLFSMQAALDSHIEEQHGIKKEDVLEKKVLALLVETGELANETRTFKFWSVKGPSERKKILEEYVDGIHFLLSLGISLNLEDVKIEFESKQSESSLTSQFLEVYAKIHEFRKQLSKVAYREMFQAFISLGDMLGFSGQDIEEAYVSKNEVNYDRQKQGY